MVSPPQPAAKRTGVRRLPEVQTGAEHLPPFNCHLSTFVYISVLERATLGLKAEGTIVLGASPLAAARLRMEEGFTNFRILHYVPW